MDRKSFLGGSLLTILYLALLATFAALDVWETRFFNAGRTYVAYHALRVLFVGFLALICVTAGRFALRSVGYVFNVSEERDTLKTSPTVLDSFLVHSYLGVSVLLLSMFGLGLCLLYYKAVGIAITAPLVFLSFPTLRAGWRQKSAIFRREGLVHGLIVAALLVVVVGLVAFHLVVRGLDVDLFLDPVDHYLPNYLAVMQQHGLRPNNFYLQFFYTKGAGLHYLGILLTDVHSFQVVNFFLHMLGVLSLYRLVQLVSGGHVWPMLAAVLYLASPQIFMQEYHKLHVALGSLVAFLAYFFVYWLVQTKAPERGFLIVGSVLAAATILAPPCLVFVLPFLGGWLLVQRFYASRPPAWQVPLLLLAPFGAFAASAFVNYYFTGLFEFTPHRLWPRYANEITMRENFLPANYLAGYVHILGDQGSVGITRLLGGLKWETFREAFLGEVHLSGRVYSCLLLGGLLLFALQLPSGRRKRLAVTGVLLLAGAAIIGGLTRNTPVGRALSCKWLFETPVLVPVLLSIAAVCLWRWRGRASPSRLLLLMTVTALCLVTLIFAVVVQASTVRFFGFKEFFQVLVYVWLLLIVAKLAANSRWRTVIVAIVVVAAAWADVQGLYVRIRAHLPNLTGPLDFAMGKTSYAEKYNSWGIGLGRTIQNEIGAAEKVQCLNWSFFPVYNMPRGRFVFHPNYFGDMERVLSGSPALARDLLEKKYGLRYFLVDLTDPSEWLGTLAYAPLFDSPALLEHFQVAKRLDTSIFLLTWKSPHLKQTDMQEVAVKFAKKRESDYPLFRGWYEEYHRKGMMAIDRRMWDVNLPKLAFFPRWAVSSVNEQVPLRLLHPTFDPHEEVILEADPGISATRSARCSMVPIDVTRHGFVEGHVTSDASGLVMLQEEYSPHWQARVGKQVVPILKANAKYMAVAVPQGTHRVTFRYRDPYLLPAIALCATGVLVLVALAGCAFWFTRRRQKPSAAPTSFATNLGDSYSVWEREAAHAVVTVSPNSSA